MRPTTKVEKAARKAANKAKTDAKKEEGEDVSAGPLNLNWAAPIKKALTAAEEVKGERDVCATFNLIVEEVKDGGVLKYAPATVLDADDGEDYDEDYDEEKAWNEIGVKPSEKKILVTELNPLVTGLTGEMDSREEQFDEIRINTMQAALLAKPKVIIAFGMFVCDRWVSDIASIPEVKEASLLTAQVRQITRLWM